ncbi:hypothetical protein HFO17_30105 [Rhizobium laguerreae]|nr:hypothetical protein [Rhizobium laguerreae]
MSARQGFSKPFRIGTRASAPAIAQASEVAARLCACHGLPAESFVIVPLTTKGDRLSEQPLPDIGVKGLFTLELEERLLAGELDMAVHSCKDVATDLPEGLHLSACLPREDARDAFISRSGFRLWELPPGAVVGTSSVRRAALVALHRPDRRRRTWSFRSGLSAFQALGAALCPCRRSPFPGELIGINSLTRAQPPICPVPRRPG